MTYRLRLDVFEGPFDLLLYLIKKNEIDIYDIPIAKILEEFLEYVELIRVLDLEVAGDFILMASTLMQIKSRMLLPQESLALEAGEEADPRADLVRRLLEYKRFREVAGMLEQNEQLQRRRYWRPVSVPTEEELAEASAADLTGPFQEVNLFDLLAAFKRVAAYAAPETFREIQPEDQRDSGRAGGERNLGLHGPHAQAGHPSGHGHRVPRHPGAGPAESHRGVPGTRL
jgi:segregation and condensation protein A